MSSPGATVIRPAVCARPYDPTLDPRVTPDAEAGEAGAFADVLTTVHAVQAFRSRGGEEARQGAALLQAVLAVPPLQHTYLSRHSRHGAQLAAACDAQFTTLAGTYRDFFGNDDLVETLYTARCSWAPTAPAQWAALARTNTPPEANHTPHHDRVVGQFFDALSSAGGARQTRLANLVVRDAAGRMAWAHEVLAGASRAPAPAVAHGPFADGQPPSLAGRVAAGAFGADWQGWFSANALSIPDGTTDGLASGDVSARLRALAGLGDAAAREAALRLHGVPLAEELAVLESTIGEADPTVSLKRHVILEAGPLDRFPFLGEEAARNRAALSLGSMIADPTAPIPLHWLAHAPVIRALRRADWEGASGLQWAAGLLGVAEHAPHGSLALGRETLALHLETWGQASVQHAYDHARDCLEDWIAGEQAELPPIFDPVRGQASELSQAVLQAARTEAARIVDARHRTAPPPRRTVGGMAYVFNMGAPLDAAPSAPPAGPVGPILDTMAAALARPETLSSGGLSEVARDTVRGLQAQFGAVLEELVRRDGIAAARLF